MLVFHRECDFLFICMPRSGSFAAAAALIGAKWFPDRKEGDPPFPFERKHACIAELRKFGYFLGGVEPIAGIRSPYSHYLGEYLSLRHRWAEQRRRATGSAWLRLSGAQRKIRLAEMLGFYDFLVETIGQSGLRKVLVPFTKGADYTVQQEDLDRELNAIVVTLGAPPVMVDPVNITDNAAKRKGFDTDPASCYDDRSLDLVERTFAATIARFGYARPVEPFEI